MKQENIANTTSSAAVRTELEIIRAALWGILDDMTTAEALELGTDISSWMRRHPEFEKMEIRRGIDVRLIRTGFYCADCDVQLSAEAVKAGYKFCPFCGGESSRAIYL